MDSISLTKSLNRHHHFKVYIGGKIMENKEGSLDYNILFHPGKLNGTVDPRLYSRLEKMAKELGMQVDSTMRWNTDKELGTMVRIGPRDDGKYGELFLHASLPSVEKAAVMAFYGLGYEFEVRARTVEDIRG